MRFVPDEIEALILLDRLDEAEALLSRLEEQALMLDRPSALATAGRCRALIAEARGRHDDSLALLRSALTEHDRVPMPFERARTLLVLGTAQRRARQRRLARETMNDALAIFDELGAELWANKARSEISRIGGRARSTRELTPTEQRIAELVAAGKTNKEVAAILVVADRTVESALTQIYRKLEVRSRTELARKLTAPS
jgi:DNA-binding CsgD family transcriptional regulator